MSQQLQYLDPNAGDQHRSRFAREHLHACAGTSVEWAKIGEALKICAAIEWLRSVEGDAVMVLCDNPEPDTREEQSAVVCYGGWTDYQDERFYGESVVAALEKACQSREGRERK